MERGRDITMQDEWTNKRIYCILYRVSFLTGPASLGRDQFQSIEKLLHLLFYRSTFTFLVGILPSSTLRTFWGGTSQKRHPVGPGIQNFTKILPAYMRTRVSHCPMYAQGHQETKVIFLKNFLSAFFPTSWSKIRRFSEFSNKLHILYIVAKLRNLKVATQYFALKTLNRESYFLRKWNFCLKKTKKMQKK